MAYIETALVSSSGKLLIQLDDGTVIDAGYVKGERGPAGRDGQDGAPGIPGARGEAGLNGSRWFTGVGAPEVSEGADGDLYMDVASSMLPIYQKVSGDWLFLANLKATPVGSGGGAAGAAGGGGSVIIFPQPDGGLPPSKDNDGKPISSGDLWYDPNTGLLWVYNGTNWLPIGDRPPVSVSPTPPLFNSSGDANNPYPIRQGDLWFDSDQAALYVAALNSDDKLVWVISTPADRSVLDDVVETTFRFPAGINDRAPINGETVYNSTTEIWYTYNAPKNQWIDLPPDSERILHTKLYFDAALDDTSTTAPYEAFVNTSDDETTTRLTVNRIDINDTDWSVIFKGLRVGTELSLMQVYKEYDPVDPTVILSETLHISRYEVTKLTLLPDADTADTINMEVAFLDQDVDLPHQFNDDVWFILNVSLNKFVKKAGDTMTGDLVMDTADIQLHNGDIRFEPRLPGADLEDFANRFSLIKSESPIDTDTGLVDHTKAFGVKVDIDDGNTFKNRFQVGNRYGSIVEITGGEGAQIQLASSGFTPNYANTGLTSGIPIRNIPTPSFEDSPGDLAVNKQYVDERDELLRQDIIELEEEIDAIAPSLEYGTWEWEQPTSNLRAPGKGKFYLLDAAGQLTTEYKDSRTVVINNYEYDDPSDSDPVNIHTWADADPGELIQLFDAADPDFMLGKIVSVNPDFETGGSGTLEFVRIQFDLIRSSGVPNDNADPVTGKYLTRVNIFKEPSGGNASEFVLKSGDTMTGDLTIDRSEGGPTSGGPAGKEAALTLKGDRTGTSSAVATIKWDNAASSYPGYLTYRSGTGSDQFFKFSQNVEFNDKNLSAIDTISIKNKLQKEGSDRITFQSGSGDTGKGTIIAHRPANLQRGFTIKGKEIGSSNTAGDVFYHYANSGAGGDSVDYKGICTSANHIMNRSQADGRYVQTGTTGIKITKSNGNYYIQG